MNVQMTTLLFIFTAEKYMTPEENNANTVLGIK